MLAAPDRFIGETLADPLEGASYGRGKAMVLRSKSIDLCSDPGGSKRLALIFEYSVRDNINCVDTGFGGWRRRALASLHEEAR